MIKQIGMDFADSVIKYVKHNTKRNILEIKPLKDKINPEKLGAIFPDGTINFATNEAAFEYGKSRCVQALNGPNPYEHGVILSGRRVLDEIIGDESSGLIRPSKYKTNIIFLHGHPDMYAKGCTTPVSTTDFKTLVGNIFFDRNVDELYAFNSLGEYSKISKKVKNPENKFQLFWNYYKYARINAAEARLLKKMSFAPIYEEYYRKMETGTIEEKIKLLEEGIAKDKSIKSTEADCRIINEFWKKNAKSFGIDYECNYSSLD